VSNPDAFSVAPDLPLGQVQQWHLSIERQLASSTVLTVAYVGSNSSQLRGINNVNAPVPGPGAIQTRRPFPAFGDILEASDFVEATYHALQVSVERRLTHGRAVLSSYTWSHALDNATDPGDTPGPVTPQNPRDIRAEKAS